LTRGLDVTVLDNLSSGSLSNLAEFENLKALKIVEGDIKDERLIHQLFKNSFDICIHLAASINVQDSIDNPRAVFDNDIRGTFNLLQEAKERKVKFIFTSTCMVYAPAENNTSINEKHPVEPASPYAAAKLSGEHLVLSYHHAYGLPVVILRPFNTYGPFQKSSGEGGVIAIFINNCLRGKELNIYGEGDQTRDFLYAEDCAEFIARAAFNENCIGHLLNAGSGKDITIKNLAETVCKNHDKIKYVPHIHPQSEIMKLECDNSLAEKLMNWKPQISLDEGLARTKLWIESRN